MKSNHLSLVFEVPEGTDPQTLKALITGATPARCVESFDGDAVAALRTANERRSVLSRALFDESHTQTSRMRG